MNELIGTVGGLLMLLLIVLFLMLALSQFRVIRVDRGCACRSWLRFAVGCGLCLLLLLAGWLVRRLTGSSGEPFDFWSLYPNLAVDEQCTCFSCGTSLLSAAKSGAYPLTYLLYRGFGLLLLGSHAQAQLCLGLMCGGATLAMACDGDRWDGFALLCVPCALLLVLPGACGLMMAMWMASRRLRRSGHNRLAVTLAVLTLAVHPFGIAVLADTLSVRLKGKIRWLCSLAMAGVTVGIGLLMGWTGWFFERSAICSVMLIQDLRKLVPARWYPGFVALSAVAGAVVLSFF